MLSTLKLLVMQLQGLMLLMKPLGVELYSSH